MNLPELPQSSDEYWTDAKIIRVELKPFAPCSHFFMRYNRETRCIKCGMGFFISVDDVIIDGHIFHADKIII